MKFELLLLVLFVINFTRSYSVGGLTREQRRHYWVTGARPVVFMHGVTSNAEKGYTLLQRIRDDFPGVKTYALTSFEDNKSVLELKMQVQGLAIELMQYVKQAGADVSFLDTYSNSCFFHLKLVMIFKSTAGMSVIILMDKI